MSEYDDFVDESDDDRPRDAMVDVAIDRLRKLFQEYPRRLFYSTQIETMLERELFHWITSRALLELSQAREVQREAILVAGQNINFYAHKGHRYLRREAAAMVSVLERIHHPDFKHAIGRQGELMFDAALGRQGFRAIAMNARAWQGHEWTITKHNLDRIIERDGLVYGVEIKNTQNYIRSDELQIKLQLCAYLQLIPLLIMRQAAKSYMHDIWRAGGFGLLFEEQLYPLGHDRLLSDVRATLGLKVQCPINIKQGDMQRLENFHLKLLQKQRS